MYKKHLAETLCNPNKELQMRTAGPGALITISTASCSYFLLQPPLVPTGARASAWCRLALPFVSDPLRRLKVGTTNGLLAQKYLGLKRSTSQTRSTVN